MARRHYHVNSGSQGGYLPDDGAVHTARREAELDAAERANQYRQDGDTVNGKWLPTYIVTGSARDGFYTVERRDGGGLGDYIEIVECYEDDCLL